MALPRARAAGVGEDDDFDGLVPTIEVAAEVERGRRAETCNAEGNRSAASTG
jgi:hypothetical protein